MKRLAASTHQPAATRPPNDDERGLYEAMLILEREFAHLRAREARLAEAVRWAAHASRGLNLNDVADMLETLIRPT